MRVRKTLSVMAKLAALAMALLIAVLWIDHRRETQLPAPTGLFAVGRTTSVWRDAARADPLAPGAGTTLLAWIRIPRRRANRRRRTPSICRRPGAPPSSATPACCSRSC